MFYTYLSLVGTEGMKLLARAFIVATLALPAPAWSGSVKVIMQGVSSSQGRVRVALCDRKSFLKSGCPFKQSREAAPGTLMVNFDNVPPGRWAVMAFHDENSNGVLDKNWLGIPVEGTAFSRDAAARFGPPSFDDAAISTGQGDVSLTMTMRY